MTLEQFNAFNHQVRADALEKCCGAKAWVEAMNSSFPFSDKESLFARATTIWYGLNEQDWREAFTHHPKIGDVESLKKKFASTSTWAEGEQAGVKQTTQAVLEALAEGNKRYEDKFGYIFIVCATGKTAEEMLNLLEERFPNRPEEEIRIAMGEQDKITRIRLEKLLAA